MRNLFLFLSLPFLLVSCNSEPALSDIDKLNGYWEISHVKGDKGKEKEFSFNENVDYFYLENQEGFRQKMQPKFEGGYITNGAKENVSVKKENDSIFIYYETLQDEWKEHLIRLTEEELVVKNEDGITYTYKKFKGYITDGEK